MFATFVTRVTQVVCRLGTDKVCNGAQQAEALTEEFAMERVTT
jgi:hypothetical protein